MRVSTLLIVLSILVASTPSFAQAPATAPTPAPTTRFVMTMPPGYEKVTVGRYDALVRPDDKAWVTQALSTMKPATRPATTMPAELLTRLSEQRAAVAKQMVADLGLADDKGIQKVFDERLVTALRQLDRLKPPVFFLVTTKEQLKELAKTGWGEPRIHYNRVSDSVDVDENVMVAIDRPMDDSVLPAFYKTEDPVETRIVNLHKGLGELDRSLLKMAAEQGAPAVYNRVTQFITDNVFDPMKLKRDQQWLVMGVTTYLGCKYTSALTGMDREQLLRNMTFEHPSFPVGMRSIDLTRPVSETAMRPAAAPYYAQAMRRKATLAVMKWTEKGGGDAVIAKALAVMRKTVPADGPALAKALQEATGVDLSKELGPQ
jgi:hypothetical protein